MTTATPYRIPAIAWGKDPLPIDRTLSHFGLIGASRTGKTTAMRLVMQSVLPGIGRKRTRPSDPPNGRAVVYDAKGDIYGMLLGMGLSCPIENLNPFHADSLAWDIAADTPDLVTGETIVERLFPTPSRQRESSTFYEDALQVLLRTLIELLIQRFPGQWTLRHLMLLAFSPDHTRSVLASHPYLLSRYDNMMSNMETAQNLRATIHTRMARWSLIAACWDRAERSISFRRWRNQQSILLLGYIPSKEKAIRRLNRFLLDLLIPICIDQQDRQMADDRTFFFLDEFNDFEATEKLSDLLTRGAGLQVHAVLGFQDMGGLELRQGREIARMLLGMCANLAVFKLNNRDSAQWASDQIGRQLMWRRYVPDDDEDEDDVKADTHFHVAEEYLVSPDDILAMAETTERGGLHGVFISANTHYGVRPTRIDGHALFHRHLRPVVNNRSHVERDPKHQFLRDFTDAERKKFGLKRAGNFKNRFLNDKLKKLLVPDL